MWRQGIDAGTEGIYAELWISLGSLVRGYVAVHGMHYKKQVQSEASENLIQARCGEKWMELRRVGSSVNWERNDGRRGRAEFTDSGRLKLDVEQEEELDIAAEAWARELIQ